MSHRPITTLFMLTSVDGKISTGNTDALDFDKDLPNIDGVREKLLDYIDIVVRRCLWAGVTLLRSLTARLFRWQIS